MTKRLATTPDAGPAPARNSGSGRTRHPVYVDRLPPCNASCPAGEDIQGWLYHAESGDYQAAWRHLTRDNPFPAIMGRICYHACERACNRGKLDDAVGIASVERFLGDEALRQGWQFDAPHAESGKHVLVVGAGPSGMSAAYHLRRLGHRVTVKEAGAAAGGMMRFGIPSYRLPRDVLDGELRRIVAMGVGVQLDCRVGRITDEMRSGGFDAAFLAAGAQIARRAFVPAGASSRILDALAVLRSMEGAQKPMLGRRVVVYGGGRTALDVARTARRLGAQEAVIVYRRARERMRAHGFELEEALQEGVKVKWLSTIRQAGEGALAIEKLTLDAKGNPQPTGEFETLKADCLVLALGQDVDLSLLEGVTGLQVKDGVVQTDPVTMMTGHPGLFAGGDMVTAQRHVGMATGHGKKAARAIDAWLRGVRHQAARKHALAAFGQLKPWYYSDAPRTERPQLDIARRTGSFDEVQGGLTEDNALCEARRCLSCGNCFECENCLRACPDNAIVKLGPGNAFRVNLDDCNGCGNCAAECPCGAIEMVAELILAPSP